MQLALVPVVLMSSLRAFNSRIARIFSEYKICSEKSNKFFLVTTIDQSPPSSFSTPDQNLSDLNSIPSTSLSPIGHSQEQQILQEPYSPNLSVSMQQINNNEIISNNRTENNNNNTSLGDIFENKHNNDSVQQQQQLQQQQMQQQIHSPKTPTNNNFSQQQNSDSEIFIFTAFRNDAGQNNNMQGVGGVGGGGAGGGLKINSNLNLVQNQSNIHDYNLRKLSYKNSEMDSNDNFSMSLKQEPETGF